MQGYSVLMSVYKNETADNLTTSVESIFAQTVPTDDFVLVCDGPLTDELDSAIDLLTKKYEGRLKVTRFEKNRGLGPALNDGLALCQNNLVARMDSDDYSAPERMELQLKAFAEDETLSIVGGAVHEFEGDITKILATKTMPCEHDKILAYAKKRCPFNHPTVMYKRDEILSLGGYPDFPFHEDYALWALLLKSGSKAKNLPDILTSMRTDSGLYGRRGGSSYLKLALKFRRHLKKIGFISFADMLYTSSALIFVCLVPESLRKTIYRKLLRK